MSSADHRKQWFSPGRVVSRAWATFRGLAPLSLAIAVIFSIGPDLLYFALPEDTDPQTYSALMIPLSLLTLFGQTAIIWAALMLQRGHRPGFTETLSAAGSGYFGILGVSLLTGLGMVVGLVLLVVPGLYLMTIWAVAMPCRLMRRGAVSSAMEDSSELTKGVRWQVFALVLCLGIFVVGAAFGAPYALANLPVELTWLNILLTTLINALVLLVTGFGPASLYHELRWGPDSGTEDSTAEVFA